VAERAWGHQAKAADADADADADSKRTSIVSR
jgi:hypothetical protein